MAEKNTEAEAPQGREASDVGAIVMPCAYVRMNTVVRLKWTCTKCGHYHSYPTLSETKPPEVQCVSCHTAHKVA